jgi:nucleoside-diphosphate-sugar epimerase
MRVLLKGASGFIGRYMLNALQLRGIAVVTVGRARAQHAVPFIEVDLLSDADFSPMVQQVRANHLLNLGVTPMLASSRACAKSSNASAPSVEGCSPFWDAR